MLHSRSGEVFGTHRRCRYGFATKPSSLVRSPPRPTPARHAPPARRHPHGPRGSQRRAGTASKLRDRCQHLSPMPERDAKLFEVLIGQMREHRDIDVVFDKPLGILGHAELFEPVRDRLHRDVSTRIQRGLNTLLDSPWTLLKEVRLSSFALARTLSYDGAMKRLGHEQRSIHLGLLNGFMAEPGLALG